MMPPDSLEIFINEQRAELGFFKIALQVFMVRLVAANPATAEERLLDLKTTVQGAVGRMHVDPADPGTDRMKQMIAMRAERFFQELEDLLHQARTRTGEAGRN
jgi:hypothetical protein